MLKILQARLQQYMNRELTDVQAGFRKGRGTRDQIANIHWIIEKAREFQKKSTSALLITPKPLTVYRSQQTGNFFKIWKTRPPYQPPEKTVCWSRSNRTRHGTTDWFQIEKGVCQSCILSPCTFNLKAEYTMTNARLDKAQAGIKIAGRNINNLRYADDTTLMAESERN